MLLLVPEYTRPRKAYMYNERTDSPHELLIGTDGWSGNDSGAHYYPDDMPEDWQLCYFSNIHRCVLLPEADWPGAETAQVEQWQEDTDPEFMFIPVAGENILSRVAASGTADWPALQLLQEQVPCVLAKPSLSQLEQPQWLQPILADRPLCVQLPDACDAGSRLYNETVRLICDTGASVLWHTDYQPQPVSCGQFLVALAETEDAAQQRSIIDRLSQWMAPDRRAALLFTGSRAPYAAEQARTLAELMMV